MVSTKKILVGDVQKKRSRNQSMSHTPKSNETGNKTAREKRMGNLAIEHTYN